MAALAGVAQSTVSYVMSGNRPISQKTRDKVEKAMRELGYVPDAHARAMISNRSHIIGLLTETTETTQGAELFPSCGGTLIVARPSEGLAVEVADYALPFLRGN